MLVEWGFTTVEQVDSEASERAAMKKEEKGGNAAGAVSKLEYHHQMRDSGPGILADGRESKLVQ